MEWNPPCELILTAGATTLNHKGLCDEFNIHYEVHAGGGGGFPRGLPWGTPCVGVRARDTRETYYMYMWPVTAWCVRVLVLCEKQ